MEDKKRSQYYHKSTKIQIKRARKVFLTLHNANAKAREAGMSYGQWVNMCYSAECKDQRGTRRVNNE